MKNLFKGFLVFAFVFVLTKLQMGTGTVYYSADVNQVTTDVNQAAKFESISDAYNKQNELGTDWNIDVI